MSTDTDKALVRRYYEDLWNGRDITVADALFTPDFRIFPDATPGPAGVRAFYARLLAVLPDLRVRVDDRIAAEDSKVVARFVVSGTQQDTFLGIPPTGRLVEITEITIWRMSNGRIAERWTVADALGALEQLGAHVAPPTVDR